MRKIYKCPICGDKVAVLNIWNGKVQVECLIHGIETIDDYEKAEGQGSLFGSSMAEHILTCLLIMVTLLAVTIIFTPECSSAFSVLCFGGER